MPSRQHFKRAPEKAARRITAAQKASTWGQQKVVGANGIIRLVDVVLDKPHDLTVYILPLYFVWDYVTPPAAGYETYQVYAGIGGGSIPLIAPFNTIGLTVPNAVISMRGMARGQCFHVAADTLYVTAANALPVQAKMGAFAALGRPSESQWSVNRFNLAAAAVQPIVCPPFSTYVQINASTAAAAAAATVQELNDQGAVVRTDTLAAYASKTALYNSTAYVQVTVGGVAMASFNMDFTILQ